MGTITEQIAKLTAWENRESAFHRVLPFLPLGAASLLAYLVEVPGTPPVGGTLAVATGAAAWIAWFLVLHRWTSRRRLMVLYYLGFLAFAAVLVLRNPWYGYFAWVGFVHAFIALPGGWRFVGVAASAVLVATAQSGGPPSSPGHWLLWILVVMVNLGVAGVLSWFSFVSQRQHANRRQLIEDLGEANRRLAESMRENEGLHAQLLNQAREAGVLDERQRMAREIHDTLAQGLVGIITQLEAADQARDRQGDWRRHVSHAAALARDSLAEARRSVQALRPKPLATAQLPDALADLARQWSMLNGITAEVHTTGQPRRLPPEIEVALLRTGQEALANAARHARASRVGMTLSYMTDLVTLDVRDDGVGFEPARVTPVPVGPDSRGADGGFGLTAMRQRISGVGGELTIESEPGAGTAVSASVPVGPGGAD